MFLSESKFDQKINSKIINNAQKEKLYVMIILKKLLLKLSKRVNRKLIKSSLINKKGKKAQKNGKDLNKKKIKKFKKSVNFLFVHY